MLRPDFSKWGQTAEEIRQLSIKADHARSRERFQALYLIGTGQSNATGLAKEIKRDDQTVMKWVHRYNAEGAEALLYKRSGGRSPFLAQS